MMFLCLMLLLSVAASAGDEAEGIWIPTRMVGIDYPVLAQQSRTHGVVKVACTIASDGTVSSAKITSGSLLLGASIQERISQWKFRFTPAGASKPAGAATGNAQNSVESSGSVRNPL
jgi:TonB family protein